ncbi:hypothetical protein IFM89_013877 [Coptis chinensis]|uniref:Uncharacterized protein n=1 Tax=Coptis chinensis TaxID=261450 RepID=A0A835LME9_9MAGN|nr:hypothetical protein IFM89_013877 [Coptis chinensis]
MRLNWQYRLPLSTACLAKRIDGMLPFISGLGRLVTFIWCGWSLRTLSAKETKLAERISFRFVWAAVVVLIVGSVASFPVFTSFPAWILSCVALQGFSAHRDP